MNLRDERLPNYQVESTSVSPRVKRKNVSAHLVFEIVVKDSVDVRRRQI